MWAWGTRSAARANSSLNAGNTENICAKTKAVIFNLGFLLFFPSLQAAQESRMGSSKVQKGSHAPVPGHPGVLGSVAIPR